MNAWIARKCGKESKRVKGEALHYPKMREWSQKSKGKALHCPKMREWSEKGKRKGVALPENVGKKSNG
jgi:hypothetical protein